MQVFLERSDLKGASNEKPTSTLNLKDFNPHAQNVIKAAGEATYKDGNDSIRIALFYSS